MRAPQLYRGPAFAALETVSAPLLVDPWLAAGSTTLLFGMPSSGKTHATLALARALIHGETLWGSYPCAKSRVLVVQADMNTTLYQERVLPHAEALTDDFAVLTTDALPLDALSVAANTPWLKVARDFAPHIVIVDTLRKVHQLDENDASVPDRVYTAWHILFPGAALLFLHHSRKTSTMPGGNADTLVREAFRGTAAWAASADTLLMLRRVRRANNPNWMTRLYFVRTRSCIEPTSLLLRLNDALLLEPLAESGLDRDLLEWVAANPRAKRPDAIQWLMTSKNGEPGCSQATAYRTWGRVMKGD